MSDKSWDRDWLVFSRKARRGVFVLLFIFVLVALLPRIYRTYFMDNSLDPYISKMSAEKREEDRQRLKESRKEQSNPRKTQKKEGFTYNIPNTPFNPNTYEFEDWKAIGFSQKQVETILNYRENGGVFNVKEDVKKLYVVDEELYLKLYDVIDLPETSVSDSDTISSSSVKENIQSLVNINKASQEELEKVSGIGPFFATKIIELREGYGGIHDLNQLLEIYRMDEEKLSVLRGSFVLDKKDVTKININKATRQQLSRHKEINLNTANSIISLRERYGEYQNLDGLLKSILIDQEKLKKLKPYLTIE